MRNIAVFYDGLVVPGAILLLASGAWLTVEFFGGWDFIEIPWLAGVVALGVIKPKTWTLFFAGCILALAVAAALTVFAPKLYPWGTER